MTGSAALIALSLGILWLVVAYLLALGIVALAYPSRALRFLAGFAQSTAANVGEAIGRGLVGLAFIAAASRLAISPAGELLGYFLVATSALMLLFPGVHKAVAARSVAAVGRRVHWLGIGSILLAIGLACLLVRPDAA